MKLFSSNQPTVKPGDQAPDFELPDQDGKPVSLRSFRGQSNVVLYFYPRDDTPGCTAQACRFRDEMQEVSEAGAVVLGVSADDSGSHRRFADKYRLPFTLLADKERALRKLYGVPKTLGLFDGRVTFVIDKQGVVRHVFSSATQPARHVDEALEVLRTLA